MSAGGVFEVSVSGLLASQRALTTTSHNISNANTEGYSRQRVEFVSKGSQAHIQNDGFTGSGVKIKSIRREYDDFINSQLRDNLTLSSSLESNYSLTTQVDNLLSDPRAGLAPVVQSFFDAVNQVANDPSSIAARQVMISQANSLTDRFRSIYDRLETFRHGANKQMENTITAINVLAESIAEINFDIVLAQQSSGQPANDLLDQRDSLIRELAQKIDVSVLEQDDGALNIFVGNGQTLVLGHRASKLLFASNQHDATQKEIVFQGDGPPVLITTFLRGGVIGGMLDFQKEMIDRTENDLGRIAIVLAKAFNEQHSMGLDLNNKQGGNLFTELDKDAPRVFPSTNNLGDYDIDATITNLDKLGNSDYLLEYFSGQFNLIRLSDLQLVTTFSGFPQDISSEGFKLELASGSSIQNGDSFVIQPARSAARHFKMLIEDTKDIAAASLVSTEAAIDNLGDAQISTAIMVDSLIVRNETLVDKNKGHGNDPDGLDENNPGDSGGSSEVVQNRPGGMPLLNVELSSEKAKDHIPTLVVKFIDAHNFQIVDLSNPLESKVVQSTVAYDPQQGIEIQSHFANADVRYSAKIHGNPAAGDSFVIKYNRDASGDNSNALNLAALQVTPVLEGGKTDFNQAYSQLVSRVGSKTHQLDLTRQAQKILTDQAIAAREAVSGVNTDEEAANLIRFQHAYQANAQVIAVANSMFDDLINAIRR